jgi:phosphohistidine phosphatase
MNLLLFRHGIAEPRGDRLDAERALTARGAERTLAAAVGLARVADRPDVLLSSPKRRAWQTAQLVAEVYGQPPDTIDALAGEDPAAVCEALRRRREGSAMLIGHEPVMTRLIGRWLGVGDAAWLDLKKAGCVSVSAAVRSDEPAAPATLHWALPPRVLRELSRLPA